MCACKIMVPCAGLPVITEACHAKSDLNSDLVCCDQSMHKWEMDVIET